MIKYKIKSVQDRIRDEKCFCLMFVEVDTEEILSTSFFIEFELDDDDDDIPRKFVEDVIMAKIESIKKIEAIKRVKKDQLKKIEEKFVVKPVNKEGKNGTSEKSSKRTEE